MGSCEKNINNSTAVHISTWSWVVPGALLHIFIFKNTNLLRFATLFYADGPTFSAIALKITAAG